MGSGGTPSSNETCTGGTTATTPTPTPTPTTPTPIPTTSWPNDETTCKTYKGVWCPSSNTSSYSYSSGSCMMAGQKCSTPVPAGQMYCWDNTLVTNWSSCPSTPTTKADCTAKNYNWCDSTSTYSSYSSGWCSASKCALMAPSGKMTCPDGETFAAALSDCPKTISIIQTTVTCSDGTTAASAGECPQYKICADGTKIKAGQDCAIKYITCSDGKQVPEGTSCPKYTTCPDGQEVLEGMSCPENNITLCAKKGGIWCADSNGTNRGFCSASGSCGTVEKEPEKLSDKDIQRIEREKKSLLRSLNSLVSFFKKINDEASLTKVQALQDKLTALAMNSSVYQTLQAIRDDIDILREIKSDMEISGQNRSPEDEERDKQMQEKALSQMKKGIKNFEKYLASLQFRVSGLEKKGVVVPQELKDVITRGLELIKTIKNATSFDEAQDAAESLRDMGDIVNDYMSRLEQLGRLQRVLPMIQREVSRQDAAIKRLRLMAKRLKVDLESLLSEMDSKLSEMRDAFASVKKGEFGDQEPFDFIQSSIVDKSNELDDMASTIQAMANLKQAANTMTARLNRYDARIKLLERRKQDVAEAKEVLAEAREHLKDLKELTAGKLTDDIIPAIKEALAALEDASEELDDLLKMKQPTIIERELQRKSTSAEKLQQIQLGDLEKLSYGTNKLANFFRQSPSNNSNYLDAKVMFGKMPTRTRFVVD